jgi:hypothetical protein
LFSIVIILRVADSSFRLLRKREVGRVNRTEAIEILEELIGASDWTIDLHQIFEAKNEFDRTEMLDFADALGNPYARCLLSYPTIFRCRSGWKNANI